VCAVYYRTFLVVIRNKESLFCRVTTINPIAETVIADIKLRSHMLAGKSYIYVKLTSLITMAEQKYNMPLYSEHNQTYANNNTANSINSNEHCRKEIKARSQHIWQQRNVAPQLINLNIAVVRCADSSFGTHVFLHNGSFPVQTFFITQKSLGGHDKTAVTFPMLKIIKFQAADTIGRKNWINIGTFIMKW